MRGQWIRTVSESPLATGTLDIDDRGDHYEGSAVLFYGHDKPSLVIKRFVTSNKENSHEIRGLHPVWCFRGDPTPLTDAQIKELAPEWSSHSRQIDLLLSFEAPNLRVGWKTDTGASGEILVSPSESSRPTELVAVQDVDTWRSFKEFAISQGDNIVFRGHADSKWRLRTHFHRTGRFNLIRYAETDLPDLHGSLSLHTKHYFRTSDDIEYGAFIHLLQHYGFPTPLLDWTRSPFVAAYFAFADPPPSGLQEPRTHVRIFAFDIGRWSNEHIRARSFTYTGPHLSAITPVAIENPRSAPQQSLSTYTNVDDLETFISVHGDEGRPPHLRAVDIPLSDRHEALRELSIMGITPASLFPGIEGVCRASKARLFGFNA